MAKRENAVACPNCGQTIDVNELLYQQIEDRLKRGFDDQLTRERERYAELSVHLQQEKEQLDRDKAGVAQQVSAGVKAGVKAERERLLTKLKRDLEDEKAEQFKLMQEELAQKSEQLKAFNKAKSTIEQLKREKAELKSSIEAESERVLNEKLAQERERIRKQEQENAQLKTAEKEHIIAQLKNQLEEAQRKAHQGSVQLQGEVQELAIESWLREHFPLDEVQEIKKGARGADCLQTVHTATRRNCGSIYYESKRTKEFQPVWVEKFKDDIRGNGADVGVLVTQAMPADMERMGLRDGVWICNFHEFKGLCLALRETVIQVSLAGSTQENRGDKMVMLYDYLTSNEFRYQVEAIVEGFTQLKLDLDNEKRAMQGIWKKREKQIDKVLLNTNQMHGSIRGIAGAAVQPVKLLELEE
jgi:hypothetical protein